MVVQITYMVHGTTQDNIDHLASGRNAIALCERGENEAKELGRQRQDTFDCIISSDLTRSIQTATLAFDGRCLHSQDSRLRECDYGDRTQKPKDWSIADYITQKYPNGESYKDVETRMASFLAFLKETYTGKNIGIVAHQAPQLALDVLIKGMSWEESIENDWRNTKAWKPGWEYILE